MKGLPTACSKNRVSKNTIVGIIAMLGIGGSISFLHKYYELVQTSVMTQVTDYSNNADVFRSQHLPQKSITAKLTTKRRFPWINDQECSGYYIDFGSDLEKVFLLSFPRSGNTWTRYLLEGATGIYTGSVFNDKRLLAYGFWGEQSDPESGEAIVIKSHGSVFDNFILEERLRKTSPNTPTILLLRNPLRAIISLWELLKSDKKLLGPKTLTNVFNDSNIFDKNFHSFARVKFNKWMELASDAIVWTKKLLVVHYTDLVNDPIKQVKRMLKFLGVAEDYRRLECLEKHKEGQVKRTRKNLIDPFTDDEKRHIERVVRKINSLLLKKNFTTIPTELY